jgi:hypothetical protein
MFSGVKESLPLFFCPEQVSSIPNAAFPDWLRITLQKKKAAAAHRNNLKHKCGELPVSQPNLNNQGQGVFAAKRHLNW